MGNEIIKYLSKYVEISKELEEAIIESTVFINYKKGTVLLREGEISNECYFIIKGCIRIYYINDRNEMTTDFFTEGQAVTPSSTSSAISISKLSGYNARIIEPYSKKIE